MKAMHKNEDCTENYYFFLCMFKMYLNVYIFY